MRAKAESEVGVWQRDKEGVKAKAEMANEGRKEEKEQPFPFSSSYLVYVTVLFAELMHSYFYGSPGIR